eukprot:Opistho-1_new@30390
MILSIGRLCAVAFALFAALAMAPAAWAGTTLDRVLASKTLRVCIWPAYYGVTYRNPRTQEMVGIDIDLSQALGKDLGAKVQNVDSSFPTLVDDLLNDRCDVAMFAIGVPHVLCVDT